MSELEALIRLFKKSLFDAIDEFCNRYECVGDKIIQRWIRGVRKEARKAKKEKMNIKALIGYALWFYNILAQVGVMAGIGPNRVNIQGIPEWMDARLVKKWLVICSSVFALQYLDFDCFG